MTTPENKVKAEVKKILARFGDNIDGFWPVPSGYGESHLDYVGCVRGRFFAIETKAPGKKPTARQQRRIDMVEQAGGAVFVIDGKEQQYTGLQLFLQACIGKQND